MASKILTLLVVTIAMLLVVDFLVVVTLVVILYLGRKKYLLGTMLLLTAVSCTFSMFFLYSVYPIILNIAVFIGLALLAGVTMFFAQKELEGNTYTYKALSIGTVVELIMAFLILETNMIMRLVSM